MRSFQKIPFNHTLSESEDTDPYMEKISNIPVAPPNSPVTTLKETKSNFKQSDPIYPFPEGVSLRYSVNTIRKTHQRSFPKNISPQ